MRAVASTDRSSRDATTLVGFTVAEWKQHMDVDEDWTERLEGATPEATDEVIAALGHTDADVRLLACNLVYALGIAGLGDAAATAVARVGELAARETKSKIRSRARLVHESLTSDLQRAQINRELPWLTGFSASAIADATTALDDSREAVRLQVYVWWANAGAVPAAAREVVAVKLAAAIAKENDPLTRRAAELALAHMRSV